MKQLLTLFIGLFWIATVYADCAGAGLSVFPIGKSINQKSIFVLTGYAESQHVILSLNKEHDIYLRSGHKKIKLLVTEVCVGQFFLTQAVLKPEVELMPGLEYTLCIDNLPKYERLERYNHKSEEYEPVTYTVIGSKDIEKPIISGTPQLIKKTLIYYGCGPAINVVFNNPAQDPSELLVKASVREQHAIEQTTFYIEPNFDMISIGHGMCSGAFVFENDSLTYEVTFSFMDASGNETMYEGEPIPFTKPTIPSNRD